MPIDKTDFFDSADIKDCGDSTPEIAIRNAISRSYYAAYHAALDISDRLEEPFYESKTQGVHDRLIKQFADYKKRDANDPEEFKVRSISYVLKQLKALRVRADYYLDDTLLNTDYNTCRSQTENAINKLADIEDSLNKSESA